MKQVIFRKFILILSLALILSGSLFSIIISNIILDKTREDMLYTLRIADYTLDYDSNLKMQVDELKIAADDKAIRYTIVDSTGKVIADSDVKNADTMENHGNREEIQEAFREGEGYARRKSGTLNVPMLYVAFKASKQDYVLRLALPFSGMWDYAGMFLPAFLLSITISLIISIILADRFSRSVSKPLKEIAEELLKPKGDNPQFEFQSYQYKEINIIADATIQMSNSVKEAMDRIELERLIRQEFFSNVSHEMKTPLTSIRGYIELLENDMITDTNMKKDIFSRIKKETMNMTNLINDILMISKLETKEVEVTLSEVRICPLLKDVCNALEPLASEFQVSLEISCRPLSMTANTQQLRELISNLITNAIKYNKPGGKVYITVTTEEKDMVIIVEDTGVGIPHEALPRIFERFYRVDKGRSKKMGGTGLGLSIVKHVVNYYNGSIEVESKLSEGTKFIVRLPLN